MWKLLLTVSARSYASRECRDGLGMFKSGRECEDLATELRECAAELEGDAVGGSLR